MMMMMTLMSIMAHFVVDSVAQRAEGIKWRAQARGSLNFEVDYLLINFVNGRCLNLIIFLFVRRRDNALRQHTTGMSFFELGQTKSVVRVFP